MSVPVVMMLSQVLIESSNGLRPVNLIGTPQAAAKAKDLIMEIVDSDTNQQNQGAPPRDMGRGQPYGGDNFGGDKINDTIIVPSQAVGMVIGKGLLSTISKVKHLLRLQLRWRDNQRYAEHNRLQDQCCPA